MYHYFWHTPYLSLRLFSYPPRNGPELYEEQNSSIRTDCVLLQNAYSTAAIPALYVLKMVDRIRRLNLKTNLTYKQMSDISYPQQGLTPSLNIIEFPTQSALSPSLSVAFIASSSQCASSSIRCKQNPLLCESLPPFGDTLPLSYCPIPYCVGKGGGGGGGEAYQAKSKPFPPPGKAAEAAAITQPSICAFLA